jgi:superfamily II DNA or RNA helicase
MRYVRLLNGHSPRSVLAEKLWANQRAALSVTTQYLDSESQHQAIVRMPTGTGKTAVIASLAQLTEDYLHVLIVVPWEHLAAQLSREVSNLFWEKCGLAGVLRIRPVAQFTPASLGSKLDAHNGSQVLICTNQSLERLYSKNVPLFNRLRTWVSLILVDEGHREPAPKWAEAIRCLRTKTILFTATPYRNDRRLFDLDPTFRYTLTFPEAVEAAIIRDVVFLSSSWSRGDNRYADFVSKLIAARKAAARRVHVRIDDVRVIVRCATREAVRAVTEQLLQARQAAIGIHHRFPSKGYPYLVNRVPDPAEENAQFWVHQEKLVEGLDDPSFRMVAIFEPFSNARSLVQQVGRIIRNPEHIPDEVAFVFSHDSDSQHAYWERFQRYETDLRKRAQTGEVEITAGDALAIGRQHTPAFYFLGDFREQLSPTTITDPRDVVRVRKSTRVFRPSLNFNLDRAINGLRAEIIERDGEFFGAPYSSDRTFLQLYEVFRQSSLVQDFYLENRLAYTYLHTSHDLVFFYDSEGSLPDSIRTTCDLIPIQELQRLFPRGGSILREVSLLNGDLGNHVFRRRVLGTDSLRLIPPALSDYIQICSTAAGKVEFGAHHVRRYVGFTRARVTELDARVVEFRDLLEWINDVAEIVSTAENKGDETLDRFALSSTYDAASPVRHVLFDIDVSAVQTPPLGNPNTDIDEKQLWNVDDGQFSGMIDSVPFEATITFDQDRRSLRIDSDDLHAFRIENPATGNLEPLDLYLNTEGAIRAVQSNGVVYAQGKFFKPNIKLWGAGKKRVELLRLITSVPRLGQCTSEKGDANSQGPGWPADCVFGVITDLSAAGIFRRIRWVPEVIICNDVGNPEIADFFALSQSPRRLVMIHGKAAAPDSVLSASEFHIICSQATRYLGFFNPNDNRAKLSVTQINGDWKIGDLQIARLFRNTTGLNATKLRDLVDVMIRDALCQREVWLVMGHGLSRSRLQQALGTGEAPPPYVIQLLYLLQSTWAAAAGVGAGLRIFCKP